MSKIQMNNIDLSLLHLGMDYVDLYIYHIWDYKTPAEEILEGMNEAVRQGKARISTVQVPDMNRRYNFIICLFHWGAILDILESFTRYVGFLPPIPDHQHKGHQKLLFMLYFSPEYYALLVLLRSLL